MPKRIPTPPPGPDEPRYLTVVHPYAISGTCNMELPKDREDFARWVACCVDKDAFFAIFHKPSSRGMVVIEIKRDYPHFDSILGEHRWSEFLQKPTKEERGRITQVFYCTYNTGRIVQKNGWKRIDVNEAWFKSWSPKNRHIKFPYPPTHFCDVPVEDQTNHPLCRPLPGAIISSPSVEIAAPQPVVGSAQWTHTKDGGPTLAPIPTQKKPNTLGAWGKGAPKSQATAAKPNRPANVGVKKTTNVPQGLPTSVRMPAVGGGPIAVKSTNVWENAGKVPSPSPVATNWEESPSVSRQSTPVFPVTPQKPAAPPGLPAKKTAWENSASSYPTHPLGITVPGKPTPTVAQGTPDRAANLSATSWGSTGASTSSPDSDSGPDLTTSTECDNPFAVHIHYSESMEEDFHGMSIQAMEDEANLRELDAIAPGTWDEPTHAEARETTDPTGWDNEPLEAEDLWKQKNETTTQVLCNAHGIICKKGICAEYARQLRLLKRAKEDEERKANRGKKGDRVKGRGAARKKNHDQNESNDQNTTENKPFRGPGAPIRTTWRGAPRAIVDADVIEKRETTKAVSDDGWGDSDLECEPNAAAVVDTEAVGAASDPGWGIPEDAYWALPAQPVSKADRSGNKPQGKKKPSQVAASSSWADQVDAELATRENADTLSTVSSKRSSKRGTSNTTWRTGTGTSKSSTSGWGSVADVGMPR